eukprot:Nitzschia sp. Nitz4//scaffold2_size372955//372021//372731//NITZ4_000487-RA/size372955-processed-gene-0.558-mRNA-1//-1//CDS//3329546970//5577//frame0
MQSDSSASSSVLSLPPRAILWDLDGTLVDSWRLGFDATQVILKENNIPIITEETYHACTRYATPDRLARHAGYLPGDPKHATEGERLGQAFDSLYVGMVTTETAGMFPGMERLIRDVTLPMGILTNACVAYAHAALRTNLGQDTTERLFPSIHGADTVPAPKPSAEGLLQICRELGMDPQHCVYVGDSPSDGHAAKAAGMQSIGVLWGSHPLESLAKAPFDVLCSTVQELKLALHHV